MTELKRQHYVPQFYLRFFSEDDQHINAYNLKLGKAFQTTISKVCQEKHFYSANTALEKAISQLEQIHAKTLKKISDSGRSIELTTEEYYSLLTFVTFQLARTRESKVKYEKLTDWFTEGFFKPMIKSDPNLDVSNDTLDCLRIKWPGLFGLTLSYGLKGVCGIFDLRPVLIVNGTERDFITSDAPVAKNNNLKLGNLSLGGLQSPGLQILCPISPKLAILLYDQDMYMLKGNGPALSINKLSDIDAMNGLQLLNCLVNVLYRRGPDGLYILKLHKKCQHLIKEREVKSSLVETKRNDNGTFSEIIKFSTENIYNRATFSFLKVHRPNYRQLKRQYKRGRKRTKTLVPFRSKQLADMMTAELRTVNELEERYHKD